MSKETALLVVDVQKAVVDWSQAETGGEAVLARIKELLARARVSETPVIYIQHDGYDESSPLYAGTEGWQIHPSIAPVAGEKVIRKRASDSFYSTTLKEHLDALGIKHLIITGCRTQYCVDTTCRSAVSLGYDVTLAKDAHTTMATDNLTAAQIIAHHNETLDEFGNDEHLVFVKSAGEIVFV